MLLDNEAYKFEKVHSGKFFLNTDANSNYMH